MKRYFEEFKNPISLILFEKGIKKEVIVKPKDKRIKNFKLTPTTKGFLKLFINIKPKLNDAKMEEFGKFFNQMVEPREIIEFYGLKIYNNIFAQIYMEYFLKLYHYDKLSYNNRTVIDIGANAGDTCLFFAQAGATVYGFEPLPPIYDSALKNINLNESVKNKIKLYCEAVSCKRGKIEISYDSDIPGCSSAYINKDNTYTVQTYTIEDIIKRYNIKPDILKIDCEGCEVEIIKNSDLSMFNDIIIEHHAELTKIPAEELIKIFEKQGFAVEKYNIQDHEFEKYGILYAYK